MRIPTLSEETLLSLAQQHLTERQRRIFRLHYFGDEDAPFYTLWAIAQSIGVHANTVSKELKRARAVLAPHIKKEIERIKRKEALKSEIQNTKKEEEETSLCCRITTSKSVKVQTRFDTTAREALEEEDC